MATSGDSNYPSPSDTIEIKWLHTGATDRVKVDSITNHSITILYLDNHDMEELQFDNGRLPFEWKLLHEQNNHSQNNNEYYNDSNKAYRWQPKSKEMNEDRIEMKRKEMPQQRNIVRTVSAITTSTNPDIGNQNTFTPHYHQPITKPKTNNSLPLNGDTVEISYLNGLQNDPAHVMHCSYFGDAIISYKDVERSMETKLNLFKNRDITYNIKKSMYHSPDINFIPAPRKGDMVKIHWVGGGGSDYVIVVDIETEQHRNDSSSNEHTSTIDHFARFKHIWVTFMYLDNKEQERLDFHPQCTDSEILSWKTLECNINDNIAGLDIHQNDLKMDEFANELCSVCYASFEEFPYRSVVPCAHNNVCAKCTLRMRVFGKFNTAKHPYPMCPFCKESWEAVAFIPLVWFIAIQHKYNKCTHKQIHNIVFSHPLEYDHSTNCYFTDINTLQKFIHIRSLYCLICNPTNKPMNYSKIYYFHNIGKLLGHLRRDHASYMCELCLNNANLFIDEQRIFINDKRLLIAHERNGSPLKDGYGETTPHPFCSLCKRNFYSKELLYEHCEDTHCSCHLCKQSGILEYYVSAEILTEHHRNMHYLCEHSQCLTKIQPIVYDDPILLKSHQLQIHRINKPMTQIRTAFTYGDKNEQWNSHYGGHTMQIKDNKPATNDTAQQKHMHQTMNQIKRRWFPNSFKQEQTQRNNQKLGLRHIPDAISASVRDEKNVNVIQQIRKTLVSQLNFKQFQVISHAYTTNKINSNVFFHRFKNLFAPLCHENVWVDILMQMLALLRDGTKRRSLYEQYRDWVISGKVNKTTQIRAVQRRKVQKKTYQRSAANIVKGTYQKRTKEMIMSQRRANKDKGKRTVKQAQIQSQTKAKKTHKSVVKNVKGQWRGGGPKIKTKGKRKPKVKPQTMSNCVNKGTVKQQWPTLMPAKNVPAAPVVLSEDIIIGGKSNWANNGKKNAKKQIPKKQIPKKQNKSKKTVNENGNNKSENKKKKKNKRKKKIEMFKPINTKGKSEESKKSAQNNEQKTMQTPPVIKKGKMPHEKKKKDSKEFNKTNPWGTSKSASPQKTKKAPKSQTQTQTQTQTKEKGKRKKRKIELFKPISKAQSERHKKERLKNEQSKSEQSQKTEQKKPKPKPKPKKKEKIKVQKVEKKEEKVKECVKEEPKPKTNKCYFEHLNDALIELQNVSVRLRNNSETLKLYANDKSGLFLCFLFETLFIEFETDFSKELKYESYELTNVWRQHIFQCVYDRFWTKIDLKNEEQSENIKLTDASYKLRGDENVLSYNSFLCNLPSLSENICHQFSALFDMLGAIDDSDLNFEPLKPWIGQLELTFGQIYCILMYLWLILDVEIPSPPYRFIIKKKIVKKKSTEQKQTKPKPKSSKKPNQQKKKNKKKGKPKWEAIDF